MNSASPIGEVVVVAWFALAAVAFWAPYGSFALPVGPLNALYALFLLISLTALALRLLKQKRSGDGEVPAVLTADSPKEDTLRRGR
jgi:membrane protein implicated in regulation of membrane protease activity